MVGQPSHSTHPVDRAGSVERGADVDDVDVAVESVRGPGPDVEAIEGIEAVVFDFGGVLISPITGPIAEVAEWHGVTMVEMLDVLMGPRETSTPDHPWHRAERGELAVADMQELVAPWARRAGIELRGDEYARLLRGDFDVYDEVLAAIARLRQRGMRTGMLTNTFNEFHATLAERIDLSLFDVVVESSAVGHRKPEPEVYAVTTELVGVEPGELLYLDDFAANLQGASAAGWRTVHVTGPDVVLAVVADVLDRRAS